MKYQVQEKRGSWGWVNIGPVLDSIEEAKRVVRQRAVPPADSREGNVRPLRGRDEFGPVGPELRIYEILETGEAEALGRCTACGAPKGEHRVLGTGERAVHFPFGCPGFRSGS